VKALAPSVLSHRVILSPEARLRGRSSETIVRQTLDSLPAPVE
jgi:MoxR-like ATPase